MSSLPLIPLAAVLIGFCGWGAQLGSLAALTWTTCSSLSTNSNNANGQAVNYAARCSFTFSMDWWVVFYQLFVIVWAVVAVVMPAYFPVFKKRLNNLFAIAIVWAVIQANARLPALVTTQYALYDTGTSDSTYATGAGNVNTYFAGRALVAGYIAAAIGYFLFIALGPIGAHHHRAAGATDDKALASWPTAAAPPPAESRLGSVA